jgi:hypothetical protein
LIAIKKKVLNLFTSKLPPNENVMEVYGAIIDADSPSLVLEYCGGGK